MRKYHKYKDSGVQWLKEIPEHWGVESFRNILKERNEKNVPIKSTERLSLSIDKGITLYADKTTNLDRFKDDFTLYKLAYKDDLVFNSMNMIVGAVGVSDYFGCVSPVYYTYFQDKDSYSSVKFYEYLFRCKTVQSVLYSLGKGLMAIDRGEGKYNTLRLKVSRDDLRNLKLPFPNFSEQVEIVSFLNEKTAKIDQAIVIKEKEIERLKERRQILIQEVITGEKVWSGNSWVKPIKTKASGISWIGEIPEHWELRKLRFEFTLSKGLTITKENLTDNGVLVINYGEIHSKYGFEVNPEIHPLRYVSEDYLLLNSNAILKNGNFVFADTSEDLEGSGNFTYLNSHEQVFAGYHTVIARPKSKINSRFFAYEFYCSNFKNQVRAKMKGVKVYSITQAILKDMFLWIPQKVEQDKIVEYLDERCKILDELTLLKKQEIEKLKEYKTVLIDNVVTGKMKVC